MSGREARFGDAVVVPEPGGDAIVRNLKRPALMFSRIAVLHFDSFQSCLGDTEPDLRLRAELDWLADRGIVTPLNADGRRAFLSDPFGDIAQQLRTNSAQFRFASAISYLHVHSLKLMGLIPLESVLVSADSPAVWEPRLSARETGRDDVIQVVLGAFPQPEESTPWEQIVEFRSDPDSAARVLALKRWISKISRESLPRAEIADEIEYLIREYQDHMSVHRLKTSSGIFESIVTGTAEVIENMAKLRFGALAKTAFAFRRRKLQLAEAEQRAPGRELAYVLRARERFDR